ncbi:MAG TPA: ABC transporter substrate-binding protein [Chloroflexota bacterium]|nr:ABC transporter substrate-binding protein [Chloroflexota bacterium]
MPSTRPSLRRRLPLLLGASLLWLGLACGQPATREGPAATSPPASTPAGSPTPAATPTPAPLATVRLGIPQGLALPLILAVERGYFQEEGIDPQRVEFASAADAMPPLSTGELDAGIGSYSAAFFNALARGIRLDLVLDAAHLEAGSAGLPLMVPNGSAVAAGADLTALRGQRVGQPARGVITEWALDRMLAEAGLGLDDTESVFMPFPDMLGALATGQLQGAVLPEPFATLSEMRGVATRARETGDYLPGAQLAVVLFSDRFARERQDAADRWAVAYLRGGRDYMDAIENGRDREAVMALLARASNLDPQVLDRMGHYPMARDGRINLDTTLAMLDWMVQRGYVGQKPDVASLVDPRFAEYARQTLDSRR